MVHCFFAVYVDCCVIVDRAEVQYDYALKLAFADFDVASVPHAVHEIGVLNAGKTALGAERDYDL